MKILVTGSTGYVGGSVAKKLVERGHKVVGLTRSQEPIENLKKLGIEPLVGSLADEELLLKTAASVDGIVNAADSDHGFAVSTWMKALAGSGKLYIQTSGSSVVADRAAGEHSDRIFREDIPYEPVPEKAGRVGIDKHILGAALNGVRSVVICPCLIYGKGTGLKKDSVQVPMLIDLAKKTGSGRYVGKGLNIWSNVHIDDLTELYALAVDKAQAGSFFYAENGEASMKAVAESISRMLGFGGKTTSLPMSEAVKLWSPTTAYYTFASNSRLCADKAKKMLDWEPKAKDLLSDIERGSYVESEPVRA